MVHACAHHRVTGKIVAVGSAAADPLREGSEVEIDCGGMWVMPGLCDAHVHCTAVTADLARLMSLPESYVTARLES